MIVDGIVHHGPDEHLHTGCTQIADAIDDDEQYGIVDGEKNRSANTAAAKPAPQQHHSFLPSLSANGCVMANVMSEYSTLKPPETAMILTFPEVILEQIGVQTVDDGSADHTHKAEKHYAQQRLIFGDFLDDVQVIELLTFRAFPVRLRVLCTTHR